jgi:hypothetical protein
MKVTESMKIHVKLDGVKYPMIILRKDEFLYREASKLVNEKLNLYRLNYKDAGSIQHWTMTAFELAFTLVKTRVNDILHYQKKIMELEAALDNLVSKEEIEKRT